MKKLHMILAIMLVATPAIAADWSFTGNIRFATWYVDRDFGEIGNLFNNTNDDQATQWYFQGNSRLEAKVRADKTTGHIELALGSAGDTSSGNGGDTSVRTRRAYGVWKFSENSWLKVGKDYSPVTEFISNQWWGDDFDLLGIGNFYGKRPAGLTLGIGSFELAFLSPSYGGDTGTTGTGINGATGGDPDSYIPRAEASYMLMLSSGSIKPFGGLQYYTVKETGSGNVTGDLNVWSWVLGVSNSWSIGPFSLGSQISYGMNEGNVTGWDAGYFPSAACSAYLKGGDDLANVYTLQAEIVPSFTVSDNLRFETGVGYRMDNADGAPGPSQKLEKWTVYLQAMLTMAPGVFLCPEVGYIAFGDTRTGIDAGSQWYLGSKWQVDF